MGITMPHFMQLGGPKAPLTGGCDKVWDQDARETLAWVVQQAEGMIADFLGYHPAPKYVVDEPHMAGLTGISSDWRNAELRTDWGRVDCFGTETLTLVEAGATVQYSDNDNDPLEREETASIGTALYADLTACALPCQVAVFFRVADGAIDAADPRFEIRPLVIDIDDTTMNISVESSLLVNPTLWTLTEAECAGSDDTDAWQYNFDVSRLVSQVDVYCRTTSIRSPVTLYWDGACDCPGICQHDTQTGCAYHTDKKRGMFMARPATWNGTTNVEATPEYGVPPEQVTVSYLSGYPLDSRTCRMDSRLERAIVKLTNSLLPEPPCGYCDAAQQRWQEDRLPVDPLTSEAAGLPWDIYSKGSLEAWRLVKLMALGKGGKLGYNG
jgi:hypothetical protein